MTGTVAMEAMAGTEVAGTDRLPARAGKRVPGNE